MDEENQKAERVLVLGMLDEDGENSVVLNLFSSSLSRVVAAAEWAKAHPEVEHVEIVLHGEEPDVLTLIIPRASLLVIVADMDPDGRGVTLQ
ncbi:hypothetical protein AB4090_05120 [Acidithiobacillus sp. IBUN Pt1247-S3]|uniref:hypothetical protein n=1 Tax=Acidithiobacillus sp. IBUN Pt1247-S3 TaxID=3166642 RepID=UPI0034E49634